MAEQKENPLVAALPPETDYITYLTIVEYNLDKNQLPLLHDLLQDTKLTTNIGWDLVHILLPLLPESEQCLRDIASLGNPRETVLKVGELLDNLGQTSGDDQEEEQQQDDDEDGEDEDNKPEKSQDEDAEPVDLLAVQFQSLLRMLCVLHPRIQTKNPSRFLTTSLSAVVNAFKNIQVSSEGDVNPQERLQSATRAVLMLIKSLSGSKRPHLPPRRSQSAIPTVESGNVAPDPEGSEATTAPGEAELKKQILQSFVTRVLEVYVQSLEPIDAIDSPLAWSTRYHEKKHPVPGKQKFSELYEAEEELERADATISQLLSSAESDLQLSWDELLHCTLDEAHTDANHKSIFTLDDLPASRAGALYALAAKAATNLLNDRTVPFDLSVFPEHAKLLDSFVDDQASSVDGDALVLLGLAAYDYNGLGDWETRAEFNQYLQRLSQLAASSSVPNVATQASELTSTILHSHPSSDARFDFIQDTLEHCPYPELKEAAVLWLKDEILSAFNGESISNDPSGISKDSSKDETSVESASEETTKPESSTETEAEQSTTFGETSNVFTHPETLKTAAPLIFSQPQTDGDEEMSPSTQAKFWLSALNLYYLLCASDKLYEALEIQSLTAEFKIETDFVDVLAKLAQDTTEDSKQGSGEGYGPYVPLIEDALERLKVVHEKRQGSA